MPYSAEPAAKKCRSCGQRKLSAEYESASPADRVCRVCREIRKPPVPVPLGDGRTAIPLVGKHALGRAALVSDTKVPLVTGYRWRVMEYDRADGVHVGPYAVSKRPTGRRGGEMIYMHKLITGYARTDYENGYPLDNTEGNLREADQSHNLTNQGKGRRVATATSQYKGVDLMASGLWRARHRDPAVRVERTEPDPGLGSPGCHIENQRVREVQAEPGTAAARDEDRHVRSLPRGADISGAPSPRMRQGKAGPFTSTEVVYGVTGTEVTG